MAVWAWWLANTAHESSTSNSLSLHTISFVLNRCASLNYGYNVVERAKGTLATERSLEESPDSKGWATGEIPAGATSGKCNREQTADGESAKSSDFVRIRTGKVETVV